MTTGNLTLVSLTLVGGASNEAATVTVASATTTDIGAAASNNVDISGTTTITGFGTVAAGAVRRGRFTGILTLTHNATSLILPGGANITTAANDRYEAVSLGSGNWLVLNYVRSADTKVPLGTMATGNVATQADQETATSVTAGVTPGRQHFHPSAAKAWVDFNGTGTLAVNASYNISSVVDGGVGVYSPTFSINFSSANYACCYGVGDYGSQVGFVAIGVSGSANKSASACLINTLSTGAASTDFAQVCLSFFGDQA